MRKYVEFHATPTGLLVTLLPEGRLFLEDAFRNWGRGTDEMRAALYEWQLCNGWSEIRPEAIAALTSSVIYCNDVSYDEDGMAFPRDDSVPIYWDPNYQIEDDLSRLLLDGQFIYSAA